MPWIKRKWYGRANQLSEEHVQWPEIDSIHRVTYKTPTSEQVTNESTPVHCPQNQPSILPSVRLRAGVAAPWISMA